jgi:cytochrome b subunit of formate dehydrogenase
VRGLLGLLIALAATAATGVLAMNFAAQAGKLQPWSDELADDFVFVRTLPAILALGVVYGFVGGWLYPARGSSGRADGAVRRFSPFTVVMHALIAVGFLLALPTGVWQYLGGIIDEPGPLPIYFYYRVHYIGGAIVLASVFAFVTYWWMTPDRSLVVPLRDLPRHLRGFALELPPVIRTRFARVLRIDLTQPAGSSGAFTFYEKAQFSAWGIGIGLITVTGIVKLLRYVVTIPGEILWLDSTLHVAAMVLLIILTLDHLRYTLARWPLVVAIATGWLPPLRGTARTAPAQASQAGSASVGDAQ